MKISKSKQELARIIIENGGWREGAEFAVQGQETKLVGFSKSMPYRRGCGWFIKGEMPVADFKAGHVITNWHQTILSRDEYFYLYPVVEAAPETVVEAKPTIEQLAAEYRNRKDFADRKQQEADDAKADADAKLAALVAAGKALGLVLGVAGAESELVITDWRDLHPGDLVWAAGEGARVAEGEYEVIEVETHNYDGKRTIRIRGGEGGKFWINFENGWRFIRRP